MGKNRLEAFSDGVIAILITIMVLEFKIPHGAEWSSLKALIPVGLSYLLSFVYLGIYWNNHHHMLHTVTRISGGILWANLHLLFWLSLIPFTTAWMGENHFVGAPTTLYGVVLLMSTLAYFLLQGAIIRALGRDSLLARAVGRDWKGKASLLMYTAAIALSFVSSWIAEALYVAVAILWLIPDRRIETVMKHHDT